MKMIKGGCVKREVVMWDIWKVVSFEVKEWEEV
jgi:hypothetical protein